MVGVSDLAECVSLNNAAAELGEIPFVGLAAGIDGGAGEFDDGAVEPPYGSSTDTLPGISKSPRVDRIRLAGELSISGTGSSLAYCSKVDGSKVISGQIGRLSVHVKSRPRKLVLTFSDFARFNDFPLTSFAPFVLAFFGELGFTKNGRSLALTCRRMIPILSA